MCMTIEVSTAKPEVSTAKPLWRQHRQAWSFEVEARPYTEKW